MNTLAILESIELKSDPNLKEMASDTNLAEADAVIVINRGYLIVKRDFLLFPELICDLAITVQKVRYQQGDLYNIPIIETTLSTYQRDLEDRIKGIFQLTKQREKKLSETYSPEINRVLMNIYDDERKDRTYYLYEALPESEVKNQEYFMINPENLAKVYEYPELIDNIKKVKSRFV